MGAVLVGLFTLLLSASALGLDGGTLRVTPFNGWRAFEIISQGDDPTGDGFAYAMPGIFDGAGAWRVDDTTLRILVNHETLTASISQVDLDLPAFQTAIQNVITTGSTGGGRFVRSARQAYSRWSANAGASFTATSSTANTNFGALCSAQSYAPNTFGLDRGFVDEIYITGEEWAGFMRLFALDSVSRDLYQLSGQTGSAPGGNGGMPFDAFENAALIDTGETDHVALMLSPDGGSQRLMLYIGEKGKDTAGAPSNSFLARNGLAYGSWYFFIGNLPALGATDVGGFSGSAAGVLASDKLEDIDTSPSEPTRVVLGDQTSGVFVFDLALDFTSGTFDAAASSFDITKISNTSGGTNSVDNPDNVDWSAATVLGSTSYPEGVVFVNEDNATGEIWLMNPNGTGRVRIGATTVGAESSGIFDLSPFVGFVPGSILITNNQGFPASMTLMIHPDAALEAPDLLLSGTILEAGQPLPGVVVSAAPGGGSATTDASGAYAVSVPADWSGTLTPSLPDYAFAPTSRSYANVSADQGNQDFTGSFDPDLTPPSPDPMSFSVLPTATSHAAITMTATTATDPRGPVEYFFECTNDPGASSTWQTDPTYVAGGLSERTQYTFRVLARDAANNQGSPSPTASALTPARPAEVLALGSWQDGAFPGYPHAAPAGSDRLLVVLGHAEANAPPTDFTSIQYGGVALAPVVQALQNQNGNYSSSAEIWILDEAGIASATGSTLVATTSGASETRRLSSLFFEGVDQANPVGQTATAGENANNTQTLAVSIPGAALDAGDYVLAVNTVRNDQNGNTSWSWSNGFSPLGSYAPSGAPYLTYSVAGTPSIGTAQAVSVTIANNGVGALAVTVLNHASAPVTICGDGLLDPGEECDDGGTAPGDCCSATCQFESSATLCRPAQGVCDVPETCDGAGTCPADALALAGLECRAAAGSCDVAEQCTGVSVACPADLSANAGTVCRPSAGPCDVSESCTGAAAECPADGFAPASFECRPAIGVCDVAESCLGTAPECPTDAVLDGTSCSDGDVCTGTETCQAGVCLADAPLACDDENECTADACDAVTGCSHTVIPGCLPGAPALSGGARLLLVGLMLLGTALVFPRKRRSGRTSA